MRIIYTTCSFLVFFFYLNSFNLLAQTIEIQSISVPVNVISIEGIFNGVMASNKGPEPKKTRLEGRLYSDDGQLLMVLKVEGTFEVGIGLVQNLNLLSVQDFTGVLENYIATTGYIPQGGFQLCVATVSANNENSEECTTQSSKGSIGLNLLYPIDGETINTLRPSLFWSFSGHSSGVSYALRLKSKSKSKASNIEAMNFGVTIIASDNIPNTYLDYPSEIDDLIEGNTYVWQVDAFLGRVRLGTTDIWEFNVGKPLDFKSLPISKSYVDVANIVGNPTLYVLGELKLKLVETERATQLNIEILKTLEKNSKQKVVARESFDVAMGENYYDLKIHENYQLQHNKKYEVRIKRKGDREERVLQLIYLNPDFFKP